MTAGSHRRTTTRNLSSPRQIKRGMAQKRLLQRRLGTFAVANFAASVSVPVAGPKRGGRRQPQLEPLELGWLD